MARKINTFDFVLESLFVTDLRNYAHLNENGPLKDLYMDYWQPVNYKHKLYDYVDVIQLYKVLIKLHS